MNGTLYALVTLVLLGAFLLMIYNFYVTVEKSNILYLGPGNQKKILSGKNATPSVYANEYTFSTFIYMDSESFKTDGTNTKVFFKGKTSSEHLLVELDSTSNKLHIKYDGKSCDVEKIPIGRWFHFAVVLRDQAVDVYIDGRLMNHCYDPVQKPKDISVSEDIVINPDSRMKLARFVYYSRALSSSEIYDIKEDGPTAGVTDSLMEMLKNVLVEEEDKNIEEITKQKCNALKK